MNRYSSNPFFNFLKIYKRRRSGWPDVKVAIEAARKWREMPQSERKMYTISVLQKGITATPKKRQPRKTTGGPKANDDDGESTEPQKPASRKRPRRPAKPKVTKAARARPQKKKQPRRRKKKVPSEVSLPEPTEDGKYDDDTENDVNNTTIYNDSNKEENQPENAGQNNQDENEADGEEAPGAPETPVKEGTSWRSMMNDFLKMTASKCKLASETKAPSQQQDNQAEEAPGTSNERKRTHSQTSLQDELDADAYLNELPFNEDYIFAPLRKLQKLSRTKTPRAPPKTKKNPRKGRRQ